MKNSNRFSCLLSLFALFAFAFTTANAQIIADDFRPFDFTDKYYAENGIDASMLIGRKNGSDGESVIDIHSEPRFRNVRITATMPAYEGHHGTAIFWNSYGRALAEAFTLDHFGAGALEQAYIHPMYVFPSGTDPRSDRQSAIIWMGDAYDVKNPLGVAAVYAVEYTRQIYTQEGRQEMRLLAARNGVTVDGTPIIRTANELKTLEQSGYITITQGGAEREPFAVAKIIDEKMTGSIAPDAFLLYVKTDEGKPLDSEQFIVSKFECLQRGASCF